MMSHKKLHCRNFGLFVELEKISLIMNENRPGQVETRKLAAIMFTDIVGFSRQMGADESRTLRLLAVHNQVLEQAIAAHHGQVIKTFGDAFLVDFPSVVHA